jgi:hypothetical protein
MPTSTITFRVVPSLQLFACVRNSNSRQPTGSAGGLVASHWFGPNEPQ